MASPLHLHGATFTVTGCLAGGGNMGALMRSRDWSKTPIGGVDSWSSCLRMLAQLLLVNRFRMFPAGVLIAGISPRLRFDALYRRFFDLVSNQVAATVGSAHAYEEEHKRAEALGEIDRAKTALFRNASQKAPDEPGVTLPAPGDPIAAETRQLPGGAELIVLAEDNSDIRDYLRLLLGERYRVHGVSNGADAVQAARELNADLVLTDVMMPVLDGFGVLKALRSDPATRSKPVILLSARAGEESRVEALHAGADDYLVKPFTARELMARVSAHLEMARIRAENAEVERGLRRQVELERNRLRDSFVEAPAAMALLSGPDHTFTFANAEYTRLSGRDSQQLIGRSVRDVFPEIVEQGFLDILDRVYGTGEQFVASECPVELDRQGRRELIYVNFTYYPTQDLSGDIEGIMVHAVDITEQVIARTELEVRVRERTAELVQAEEGLRELNHRLLQAQDEERRRLALELHDSAGRLVAALKFNLLVLQEAIVKYDAELSRGAATSTKLLDQLSRELRTISHQLHPPVRGETGLSTGIRMYLEELAERSGLSVSLKIDDDLGRQPKDIEMAIFRIVQESLTNVRRYAQTETAVVLIRRESGNIRVEIQDEGRGIQGFTSLDDRSFRTGGGIQGMRERTRQLKGQFDLLSGPGGTAVRVLLPSQKPS